MEILDELKSVIGALDRAGVEYALCGGLALAVYDLPRATLAIDLLIQVASLPEARRVVEPLGFTWPSAPMTFHQGDIQLHRLVKIEPETGEHLVLDLLLVTAAVAAAWETRRDVTWEGGRLKVVTPDGLILLKTLRGSGQDQDDIAHLRRISDEA